MKPNWAPLENRLGRARCAGFMFMGRINGINLYKHGIVRLYVALDDSGQCFVERNSRYERADFEIEIAKIEAALREIGETLENSYDQEYLARKQEALKRAGLQLVKIYVEPEDVTINWQLLAL